MIPRPTAPKQIRIVLVDDHPVVREGLRSILGGFQEICVAGEASSGREAIEVTRALKPDVVLMDITMPEMNGIEATAALVREAPDCKVLALSMHDNGTYASQALRAGARGYLLKDTPPAELAKAIADVHAGAPRVSRQLTQGLLRRATTVLTPRELDILRLMARGLSNKQMSVELNVSVRTIETHRENLIRKTGLNTVPELIRYAVNEGFVDLRSSVA